MKTLTLLEAARFLKMHPEELRRRARLGLIPGAKVGKCWVFLDLDLAGHIRSLYAPRWQALRVTVGKEANECHSTNAAKCGGFVSPRRAASLLDNLLKRKTGRPRGSSTTS